MFSFDVNNNLLLVDPDQVRDDGTLVIEAVKHVYSESREWEATFEGMAFDEVVAGTGGVVLPSGLRTEIHVILQDDWRIQPPDNAKTIQVIGNLHRHDNSSPFVTSPSGNQPPIDKITREGYVRNKVLFYVVLGAIVVGLALLVLWMVREPSNIEPYATFAVVFATLIQLIRNGLPR